jgi:hypothetical protein
MKYWPASALSGFITTVLSAEPIRNVNPRIRMQSKTNKVLQDEIIEIRFITLSGSPFRKTLKNSNGPLRDHP